MKMHQRNSLNTWAKKLAEENGLIGNEDFEKLKGSSKKGKYNVEDVKNFLRNKIKFK